MTRRSLAIGLQSIHMHPTGVDAAGNERLPVQLPKEFPSNFTLTTMEHPQQKRYCWDSIGPGDSLQILCHIPRSPS